MKALEFWAKKHYGESLPQQEAFVEGFAAAKRKVTRLLEEFQVPQLEKLTLLIESIGTAEVNPETGKQAWEEK